MSNEYKLVPVEPTEEMIHVGCDSYFDCESSAWSAMAGAYKAMLASAPQPPALGGEPDAYFADINDPDETGTDKPDFRTVILLREHRAHLATLQAEIVSERNLRRELAVRVHQLKDELKDVAQLQARCDAMESALKFYADREHYHFDSGNWHTVSGEPLNILWCGDEPDFIEDGTVARAALSKPAGSEQV